MSTFGGLGCLTLLLALSAPAYAQKAEADAAFQRGRALMDKGETAQACVEFEASMRFEAQSGTLYNLALCHEQLGKLASAYSEFKELASTDTNKPRAKDSARHAKALEPRLTKMHLVGKPVDGLTITRDGLDVTVFVGQEVPVDPRSYTFVASAPDREPATFTVALDKPGTVDVAIPDLATTGGTTPIPTPTAPTSTDDPYALDLVHRPLALPRRMMEVQAGGLFYTSQSFMTDPIDVGARWRMGLGAIEVAAETAVHARYPTDTDRADALAFLRAGARYLLNPRFTGGFDYTWYQPTGVGMADSPVEGSDLNLRLARKYGLGPQVAIEGQAGVQFAQRTFRGGGDAQEFAAIGRGAVQLAATNRVTFEADTDIAVNLGGELYKHTLGLTLTGSIVVGIDRRTDAFAAASFVVAPSESDLKIYTVGVTRRIP